ncbi:MAG: hypothetical protein ACR2KV_04610 [Solirubrobacteraceae bacterium]
MDDDAPTPAQLPRHDGGGLRVNQLKGLDCMYCGRREGAMRPVYLGPFGPILAHPDCDSADWDRRLS